MWAWNDRQQFEAGFPGFLRQDVEEVLRDIPEETYATGLGISQKSIPYTLSGAAIQIPDRVYYLEAPDEALQRLSPPQTMMYHCIYSRSCNGYVREKHIPGTAGPRARDVGHPLYREGVR